MENAVSQEPTRTLVDLAARGNNEAVEVLCDRFRPRLMAWAHGRLPAYARGLKDTEDLVQEALAGAASRIALFQNHEDQSFLHYVRKALHNNILNEIRRAHAQNHIADKLSQERVSRSPIDELIDHESAERYEGALMEMSPQERDLIISRLELDLGYRDIAIHCGLPSPDAARMAVSRTIKKLATRMR